MSTDEDFDIQQALLERARRENRDLLLLLYGAAVTAGGELRVNEECLADMGAHDRVYIERCINDDIIVIRARKRAMTTPPARSEP